MRDIKIRVRNPRILTSSEAPGERFVTKNHVWSVWLNLLETIELKMSFIVIGPVARKKRLALAVCSKQKCRPACQYIVPLLFALILKV